MLWILFVVVVIGVAGTLGLAWAKQQGKIQPRLAAIVAPTVLAIGIGYFSGPIALNIAQTGAVAGYQQSLNGTVLSVADQSYQCYRDGPCVHTYDCDSYQVLVHAAYTDSNNNYHAAVYDTDYHQCPVATWEFKYTITAKAYHAYTFTLVDHGFARNPKPWCCAQEVDGDSSIPSSVPRGVPAQWLKAKRDKAAGNSDAVTVHDSYANYILANEATIFRKYSDDIGMLRKRHLLPPPPLAPIYDNYLSRKVYFVGLHPSAPVQGAWQSVVAHLNADLGTNLQGDMHVVAVNANVLQGVISPFNYARAIQADWLNDYGKEAVAKNAIILVVGVNPLTNTIAWAQADTGMPNGNEAMLQTLHDQLPGVAFTPNALFGNTTAQVVQTPQGTSVHYTLGSGTVTQIVMRTHAFLRACMGCQSARDKKVDKGQQGYVYLKTELPLPAWGVIVTIIVDILILAILTAAVLWIDSYFRAPSSEQYRRRTGVSI